VKQEPTDRTDIDRYVEEDFKKLMYVGCSSARTSVRVRRNG
jgi:hypothetical protein